MVIEGIARTSVEKLTADATKQGPKLAHHWNVVVGAGRASEGLRADWQEQLKDVISTMGFRYIRFHGLFHDDMFVYQEKDGAVAPYFQYVDVLFDRLLELGIRPFVEFGFMPSELARDRSTVFWWKGNGSPPTDLSKWEDLVRSTVGHWVERYGIDEVLTWYFEVWNEPNLAPFFTGMKSDYFELYRRTARAVKSIDERLRVGGPATSNFVPDGRFEGELEDPSQHRETLRASDLAELDWQPVWLRDFLAFAAANGLPVDFVSAHPYPTDWALDEHGRGARLTREVDATRKDLALLRSIVDASPFPGAEIHLTEWNSSSSPRDHTHDYLQAATFIVKTNLDSIGLVDSLAYWTFTDVFEENGAGREPFHGGFGMLNQHGIPKPSYHAYRFLSSLGCQILARAPHGVMTRRDSDDQIVALLHNYSDAEPLSVPASFGNRDVAERTLASGEARGIALEVLGVAPGAVYRVEYVDGSSGNALHEWTERGAPINLSRADVAALDSAARNLRTERLVADEEGRLAAFLTLEPWAIALVSAEPR